MKPMEALAQLRGVVMASVLPCTPMQAEGLLNLVGEGLMAADELRAEVQKAERVAEGEKAKATGKAKK